jgi:hypothetical protein
MQPAGGSLGRCGDEGQKPARKRGNPKASVQDKFLASWLGGGKVVGGLDRIELHVKIRGETSPISCKPFTEIFHFVSNLERASSMP